MNTKASEIKGDSISRLLQIRADIHGVKLPWCGRAIEDLDALCADYANRRDLNDCLWKGLQTLMEMPELKTLPEPIYAQILSIILRAQGEFELQRLARAASAVVKQQQQPPPPRPVGRAPA